MSDAEAAADAFLEDVLAKPLATPELVDEPTWAEDEPQAPKDWRSVRAIVLHRDGYACAQCSRAATEVDHIWPKSKGGSDKLSNLQALCRRCNAAKGDTLYLRHITVDRLYDAWIHELETAAEAIKRAAKWGDFRSRVLDIDGSPTIDELRDIDAEPDVQAHRASALSILRKVLGIDPDEIT